MRLSDYKEGLLTNNIPVFINTLEYLKDESVNYSEIRRMNTFLKKYIDNIDKNEIIEKDKYRIIPYKYSLIYLFSLFLQCHVDFAEYKISLLKQNRYYSASKRNRTSDDYVLEDNFNTAILNNIISILSRYDNKIISGVHGFKDINEINNTLEKSNINIALSNINKLINIENTSSFDTSNFLNRMSHNLSNYVNSENMLNKINIIHIPVFNNDFPSIYINKINTIIVSQTINNDNKERILLREFGMYTCCEISENTLKAPRKFSNQYPFLDDKGRIGLFCDLFAYKMLKGTSLESKETLSQNVKNEPDVLLVLDKDSKYFDTLL